MSTTESTWKSRVKSIFENGYLSFGLGIIVGLAIDNFFIVLAIALVIGAVMWYAKREDMEEEVSS